MPIIRKWLITIALMPVTLSAFGFNEHKTVAAIAWRELTPEARASVKNLMSVSGDISMMDIAIWADTVRSREKYMYSSTYHYVNIPADGGEYDQERDCPDYSCITEMIPKYIETLQDSAAGDSLKNEALKFIVHFVADIHQPMHAGLPEDRGGNDVKLLFRGKKVNLHGLWDYDINNVRVKNFDKYAIKRHKAGKKMNMKKIVSVTDPVAWTNESYKIARRVAYKVKDGDKITRWYERRARKHIDRRITIAGYRLGYLLNGIFDR